MKVILDIQRDSHNTYPSKLEVTELATTLSLKVENEDREIQVSKDDLKRVLKVLLSE